MSDTKIGYKASLMFVWWQFEVNMEIGSSLNGFLLGIFFLFSNLGELINPVILKNKWNIKAHKNRPIDLRIKATHTIQFKSKFVGRLDDYPQQYPIHYQNEYMKTPSSY